MANRWMHFENLPLKSDVTCEKIDDNETWNTCPECKTSWKDEIPIQGLLHRTRLCETCYPLVKARYERS